MAGSSAQKGGLNRTHRDSYPEGKNGARSRGGSWNPGGRYGYRMAERRQNAADMAEARAKRSPQEQIAILDARLGEGVGAVKERARLQAQIDAAKE